MTSPRAQGLAIPKGDGWIFIALLLVVGIIGEALKVFRTPALLLIVLLAAMYAREMMFRKQNLPLLLFSAWTLAYVILSYFQTFPAAWTRYHDNGVIFQQASFLAVLLPVASASQKWWEDPKFDQIRELILIGVVFATFVVGAAFDIVFSGDDPFARPFVTMRSYLIVALLALTYLAFRSRTWGAIATMLLLILLALSFWRHLFLQNTLVYVILFGFLTAAKLRVPADRLMLGIFLALLAGVTIYGIQNPLQVFEIDPNTGWRLAWWKDAIEATVQNGGVGLGFGTESLRNEYGALLERDSYREEGGTFLLVGTHSAFFDTMLRTGLVGIVLLLIVLVRCFPTANIPPLARAHCCAVFAIITLCLHSNLGLQSPMYSIGIAVCIGFLQAERRKAHVAAADRAGNRVDDASRYDTPFAPQSTRNRYR